MRPKPKNKAFNDRWHELAYQVLPEMKHNQETLPPVASFDADVATLQKFFDQVWNEALDAAKAVPDEDCWDAADIVAAIERLKSYR